MIYKSLRGFIVVWKLDFNQNNVFYFENLSPIFCLPSFLLLSSISSHSLSFFLLIDIALKHRLSYDHRS